MVAGLAPTAAFHQLAKIRGALLQILQQCAPFDVLLARTAAAAHDGYCAECDRALYGEHVFVDMHDRCAAKALYGAIQQAGESAFFIAPDEGPTLRCTDIAVLISSPATSDLFRQALRKAYGGLRHF